VDNITYAGESFTHFRKLFKKQNLGVAFETKNTTGKVLNVKKVYLQRTKYENSSVYRHRCLDCNFGYNGQTGRQFKIRYNEHFLHFNNNNNNNNNNNSALAQYLIKDGHSVVNIDGIMDVLYITRKGTPRKDG
jgi:hypothetical protein